MSATVTALSAPRERGEATTPWQRALRDAVRDPAELMHLLALDEALLPEARRAAEVFPLRVPRGFVARMRRGDPRDPLLAQVLPLGRELAPAPGYGADPLGEAQAHATPGLLRKYRGRALLVTTGACAVHCRYCFRRHFPYGDAAEGQWAPALEAIAADPTLSEAILSGGDPLALPDRRLAGLARRLAAVPHLRRLRVHTRLPVVLPERVDDALLEWLCGTRLQPVLVLHANHPAELDDAVRAALGRLRAAGVPLLNQAVLLRGINDDAEVLCALGEGLFAAGVLPYYLHLLDPVAGAAHFDVGEAEARALVQAVRATLPGYLVPRLVRELPGAPSKVPL
jgi:EF-P beta-lysylation protein EpmB